ncbi:MAG: GNAT family N-acetyltransferase [Myxococcota bacterium]
MIRLRAPTAEDEALLWQLYLVRRADETARWGLPPAELEALMRMQHRAERAGWARDFPDAEHHIVEVDGVSVGRAVYHADDERMLVVDMAFLPSMQGRGIGGRLFADLIARAAPRPVEIAMFHDARSRAFGEKQGFRVSASDEIYLRMRSH